MISREYKKGTIPVSIIIIMQNVARSAMDNRRNIADNEGLYEYKLRNKNFLEIVQKRMIYFLNADRLRVLIEKSKLFIFL